MTYRSISKQFKEYLSSHKLFQVIGLCSVIILLIVQILIGIQKPLWHDEIATLKVIRVPALYELISLCYDGADTNPPLYYIFLWFLRQIVGENIIIFRIFSSIIALSGTATLFLFFREKFKWSTDTPILLFLFTMPLWQFTILMEIRAYALWYFLLCIYFISYYSYLSRPEKPFALMLILTIDGTMMAYTHYYAVIYLGVICVIEILSFMQNKNHRFLIISLLPILFFLPWIPAIIHQREFLHWTTWQAIPTGKDIYYFISDLWGVTPFTVLFLAYIYLRFRKKQNIISSEYIFSRWKNIMMAFLIVPIVIFITSQTGQTIFLPRYFMGTFLSGILFAWIILDTMFQLFKKSQTLILILLMCLAGYRILQYHKSVQEQIGKVNKSLSLIKYNLPILCSNPHTYYQLSYYANNAQNKVFFFVNDSITSIYPGSVKNAVVDYYGLQSPFFKEEEILSYWDYSMKFKSFLFIDEPGRKLLQSRILPDTTYDCKKIETNIYCINKKPQLSTIFKTTNQ